MSGFMCKIANGLFSYSRSHNNYCLLCDTKLFIMQTVRIFLNVRIEPNNYYSYLSLLSCSKGIQSRPFFLKSGGV